MSRDNDIPWWGDLLPGVLTHMGGEQPLTSERLDRLEKAASNITLAITQGLAATGELLWRAAYNTDSPVDTHTLAALGFMQSALAELIEELNTLESNAIFGKQQLELAAMRGSQTQKKAPATAATVQGH